MAGMLHEIILRQTQASVRATALSDSSTDLEKNYRRALKAYKKLVELVRSGDGDAAEALWRKHLALADELVLAGHEATRVIDVLD
jgi:DNA-binding FadR family transcriptional regulator